MGWFHLAHGGYPQDGVSIYHCFPLKILWLYTVYLIFSKNPFKNGVYLKHLQTILYHPLPIFSGVAVPKNGERNGSEAACPLRFQTFQLFLPRVRRVEGESNPKLVELWLYSDLMEAEAGQERWGAIYMYIYIHTCIYVIIYICNYIYICV